MHHPIDQLVKTILEAIFAENVIPPAVRKRALELQNSFSFTDATYLGPEARRATGREYDEWIDEIFHSIIAAEWREDVLRDFIRKLGILIERGRSDALFALVIEEIREGGEFIHYRLGQYFGRKIHDQH